MSGYPYARGGIKPVTEIWNTMWGLWLVAGNPEASQQQAACWLASGQLQSHMKIVTFS